MKADAAREDGERGAGHETGDDDGDHRGESQRRRRSGGPCRLGGALEQDPDHGQRHQTQQQPEEVLGPVVASRDRGHHRHDLARGALLRRGHGGRDDPAAPAR